MSTNEFQQDFMRMASSSYNLNVNLLQGYKETARQSIERLEKDVCELQHVEAHLNELRSAKSLKIYFDEITKNYKSSLRKNSVEFTKDVSSNYENLDKRLKSIFIDEGIREKDLYIHIEENKEAEIASFVATAEQIDYNIEAIDNVQEDIATTSKKLISKTDRKTKIRGIYMPILILVAIIFAIVINGVIKENTRELTAVSSEDIVNEETSLYNNKVVTQTANLVVKKVGVPRIISILSAVLVQILWLLLTVILVFIAIWVIYYKTLKRILRKKMILELESEICNICKNFSTKKDELLEVYIAEVDMHLNEINRKYFLKFQPLVTQVIERGG